MDTRYRLLPYFYTLLQNASDTGHPVLRPLFLNFPSDPLTFANNRRAPPVLPLRLFCPQSATSQHRTYYREHKLQRSKSNHAQPRAAPRPALPYAQAVHAGGRAAGGAGAHRGRHHG